ncbi:PH domain-containing protein [Arcanobacterium haemolyticum]|nr:PH domain-containing protein [Arcanobacterium haemolyticum]
MEPIYKLRTTSQYAISCCFAAIAALILILQITQVGTNGLLPTILFCIGIALFGFGTYAMPYLEVNARGVVVANTLATTYVDYPDIDSVDSRWGLRLATKTGPVHVRTFGSSSSSLWQSRPGRPQPRADHGAHKQQSDTYRPGNPIPIVGSGVMSMRATTHSASKLIDDMRDIYGLQPGTTKYQRGDGSSIRREIAWIRVAFAGIGVALAATGIIQLF